MNEEERVVTDRTIIMTNSNCHLSLSVGCAPVTMPGTLATFSFLIFTKKPVEAGASSSYLTEIETEAYGC